MDMLDERGLLFWCEIPLWGVGFGEAALNNPTVVERGLQMHKEMTHYYYNHPSIIIWGMHNEINTSYPCTHEISRQYHAHLRANGGNRLITHAAKLPFQDSSMEFDDIICMNLYYGWYGGTLADWDQLVARFDEHRKAHGWQDKPVIMSEFGCAALYGYHEHFDSVRWSEEYQSELLSYCLELFHKTEYMCGTYIWQFANIRTSPSMDINRARYFNNKGILDEHRNPKAAYFTVKKLYQRFRKEPSKKNT
jgi:beta-glucuronidase